MIISQQTVIVNDSGSEKLTEKWTAHKKTAKKVAKKLYAIGYEKRGDRMYHCADTLVYNYCRDCDTFSVKRSNLCRDRMCPTCNWRLSLQRYGSMQRILAEISKSENNFDYTLVTLTVKNCAPSELSETLEKMYKAYDRLMHRRTIKAALAGWAKSVEVTYNNISNTVHPHYHIIMMWHDAQHNMSHDIKSMWIESIHKEGLHAVWEAQNAQDIQAKDDAGQSMAGAICETFKYAVKSKHLDDMPLGVFKSVADCLNGKRLVSFGGIIKTIAKELKVNMESVNDEDITVCNHCGSISIDTMVYKWSFASESYTLI